MMPNQGRPARKCLGSKVYVIGTLALVLGLTGTFLYGCFGGEVQVKQAGTHGNADIFLPMSSVFTLFGAHREEPVSWYREDDRHLVVATERYVLRLVEGNALWVVRVPSKAKGQSDSQPSTKACRGADGVIWVVHWPPRGGEYHPVEPRMTFCALSRDTGRVLAKSDFVVPSRISPDVVSMIARDQDCLVFLGDTRNLSHAEVEAVACVSCVRGAVRIALDDPLSLVGWICADSRSTPAGDSLVFTRSSPDGAFSIKVVRTDPLPSRSITVHGLPESSFRSGALDLMADDVLLSSMGKFREKGRGVSFDLRTGETKWHQWTPYVADSWGNAFVQAGKAYVFSFVEDGVEQIMYMIDCNSGEAAQLIAENDFRLNGRIRYGPTLIAREGEILFATDSATKKHDEVKHNVYAMRLSDKSVRLVETVHIKGDADERFMGGDIRFLLPAAKGYWLGSGCGAIAYREYASPQEPKRVTWGRNPG